MSTKDIMFLESSDSSEGEIKEKTRKKKESNVTPEMEQHLDTSGTHCLKCRIKTKDIVSIINQVNSRTKTGGTKDIIKSKCSFCNTNKNRFATKLKTVVEPESEPVIITVSPEVVLKGKRGRKPKITA